jgi:hypothetical protein
MIALILSMLGIYAIVPCDYGYYVDVHGSHYEFYAPMEKWTNNYIQIDCNE